MATLWAHAVEGKSRDEYKSLCSQTIAENRDVLICFPRPDLVTTPAAPLKVKSWGPQETTVGVVPNQQPSGEGAFWFVVESPMPQRPKVLLLLDHQVVDPVTWSADGTWFSALLPRQLVSRPQAIPVRLWDLCRNQTVEAGVFRVQNPQKR
ncbi:MAG: hypothetical protein RMI39_09950 [Thermoanaerobaculum sp.]|nr:hypothetical protein [Thermoanaerobaculum sp.]